MDYVTFRYAATASRGPLNVYWCNNGLRPAVPLGVDPDDAKRRLGENVDGLLIVGEKGYLTSGGWSGMPRLLPLELHQSCTRPPKTIPQCYNRDASCLR